MATKVDGLVHQYEEIWSRKINHIAQLVYLNHQDLCSDPFNQMPS